MNVKQQVTCLFSAAQLRTTLSIPTECYETRAPQILNNTEQEGA